MAAKPKFPQTPDTANEQYFDATLRHQIGIRRTAGGIALAVLLMYEKADRELSRMLRRRLPSIRQPSSQETRKLFSEIRESRRSLHNTAFNSLNSDLSELATIEDDAERAMILASLGFSLPLRSPSQSALTSATRRPFAAGTDSALTLRQWFSGLSRVDEERIFGAIQLGLQNRENTNQIVGRVIGTSRRGFGDGTVAATRRNAEVIARTGINATVNAAREEVWLANQDMVLALRWTSILDGRTSAICRSRDGLFAPIGGKPVPPGLPKLEPPGARPPAHPNCRSIMTAILDGDDIAGLMPNTIILNRTNVNFVQQAKRRVGNQKWIRLTKAQRAEEVLKQKTIFTKGYVSGIPQEVTYGEWLARQPAKVQDEILGKKKGKLFRKGGLTVDKFVDQYGNELTLKQLKAQNPTAFIRAGL